MCGALSRVLPHKSELRCTNLLSISHGFLRSFSVVMMMTVCLIKVVFLRFLNVC